MHWLGLTLEPPGHSRGKHEHDLSQGSRKGKNPLGVLLRWERSRFVRVALLIGIQSNIMRPSGHVRGYYGSAAALSIRAYSEPST